MYHLMKGVFCILKKTPEYLYFRTAILNILTYKNHLTVLHKQILALEKINRCVTRTLIAM